MVFSSSIVCRGKPVSVGALLGDAPSPGHSSSAVPGSRARSGLLWRGGPMEMTVGGSGGSGTAAGAWMMHGPPPLPFQSTGGAHLPVTLTPFLLPTLMPVPSTWSLLLLPPS